MIDRYPRDIFKDSSAWERLTNPSPPEWSVETVRLKHDVTQVFQTLLAAVQELQVRHQDQIELHQLREEHYQKLYNDLFNPKDGAFVTARTYTDGKFSKLQNLGWAVLGTLLGSGTLLVVQLAIGSNG